MRLLIVGNGGREHALLWKLARDHPEHDFLITKGNGGTGELARPVEADPSDVSGVREVAEREGLDFVIVGPEAPLAAGLADALREAGIAVFGPGREAARLESSKAFAKRLMADAGVPTARFEVFTEREPAAAFAAELGVPCVVKASGLAAGKGALVCRSEEEVADALDACLLRREFGEAGDRVVVEEFLEGEEVSMITLTDGEALPAFLPSQDHKAAYDGDRGPNTGGMGAYAPVSIVDEDLRGRAVREIFRPTREALSEAGAPFSGCMYAGLMLTEAGPKVLEWNVRFGDPEAQALLPLLESDLLALLSAATPGGGLSAFPVEWRAGSCVTVVLASEGYPGAYETGVGIDLPATLGRPDSLDREGVVVFHAGTTRENGRLVTAGGRVLNVTAVGDDVMDARRRAYQAVDRVECEALRWRTDIAWREVRRREG